MTEHFLEIKITQPGRVTGQYFSVDTDTLRLEKIVHPEESIPFDVGILPTAFTPFNEPLAVLVLGSLSHPKNTELESRLLGGLQRNDEAPILLVIPAADECALENIDLTLDEQCSRIVQILNRKYPGQWRWLTIEELEPELHTAVLRHRKKQAEGKIPRLDPDWQPLRMSRPTASYAEAERHTPAEYTFYELPHRFQQYVGEYLAADERILYAVRRPAMPSHRRKRWFRRVHLQEGVLILTSQRLIQLTELLPPDSTNVRYGIQTTVGVLERLAEATLTSLNSGLFLRTKWRAEDGEITIEWESPDHTRASLDELVSFLDGFQVDADDCALQRGRPPAPPEKLPPLTDTASDDPDRLILLNEHFSNALTESLLSDEQVRAWALLPKWLNRQKTDEVLVVTEKRIFQLPDRSIDLPLAQVATLEYTSSILQSSLVVNYIIQGRSHRKTINFPYPAQDAFRDCFEAARRCMAVVPLSSLDRGLHPPSSANRKG